MSNSLLSGLATVATKGNALLGTVANFLGFGSTIASGSVAAKLMSLTMSGGKVFKGISMLQSAGATVANAGIIITIVEIVGTAYLSTTGIAYVQCKRDSKVEDPENGYLYTIKENLFETMESIKDQIMKLWAHLSGNESDFDKHWEDIKARTLGYVISNSKKEKEPDSKRETIYDTLDE